MFYQTMFCWSPFNNIRIDLKSKYKTGSIGYNNIIKTLLRNLTKIRHHSIFKFWVESNISLINNTVYAISSNMLYTMTLNQTIDAYQSFSKVISSNTTYTAIPPPPIDNNKSSYFSSYTRIVSNLYRMPGLRRRLYGDDTKQC